MNGGTSVFSVSAAGQMTSPTILTGNGSINFVGNAVLVGNNTSLRWAATAFAAVTTDTTLSRASAGVLAIGAGVGAAGDDSGTLRAKLINTGQITQPARLTAQSASIAATPIKAGAATLPAGLYRVNYYLNATTAGTAGTVTFSVTYTDDTTAQTQTSVAVNLNTVGAAAHGDMILYTAGGVDVQFVATVAGATGSPAYALTVQAERLA